ncbi:hypothetical protein SAMN05660443_0636 [Marinospirillum celere]|uniref:Uncharacterized protein n=1 Tax=Marinospirillum celere TaxID=1122252 RepID=A0A1I1EK31_9GAMM|nr:hypothetical protein [Marinospirillum celere]SFB87006.1 hypothetical protein SAMN05660443_0636 [Marinospirillum celere]
MLMLGNLCPDDLYGLSLNIDRAKEKLPISVIEKIHRHSPEVDPYSLAEDYGIDIFDNVKWIEVKDDGCVKLTLTSHEILLNLYPNPSLYEGVSAYLLDDNFLCLAYSLAEGQDGGFAIIKIETGDWVLKKEDFVVSDIVWINEYSMFACLEVASSYSGEYLNLLFIVNDENYKVLSLFSGSNIEERKFASDPLVNYFIECEERPRECSLLEFDDKNKVIKIVYFEKLWMARIDDLLKFSGL